MHKPSSWMTAVCLAGLSSVAAAQSADRMADRVWLQVGVTQARLESNVVVEFSGDTQLGLPAAETTLNLERDLGLASKRSLPFVRLGVRPTERTRIEFEHYELPRSGRRQLLDETVVIGDTTYAAQAVLDTRFDSRVSRLGLGYSFLRSPRAELGVSLALQYTRYTLSLEGEAVVNGSRPRVARAVQSDSGSLPTLGLYGGTALGDSRWSVGARADFLEIDGRRARGNLRNYEANLYYRLASNWSASLGYRFVAYDLDRKGRGELDGRFEYAFDGPQLQIEFGF